MIILTTFLTIGFVSAAIGLCWLSDKYSETLDELERYKRQTHFLQKQIKENPAIDQKEAYKKALDDFIEKMNEQSEIARPVGWSAGIEIITMSTVRSIKEELMKEEATQNENC